MGAADGNEDCNLLEETTANVFPLAKEVIAFKGLLSHNLLLFCNCDENGMETYNKLIKAYFFLQKLR